MGRFGVMMKKIKTDLQKEMQWIVYEEFKDCYRAGVIVVTREEMTNVFINLLADFLEFQRQTKESGPHGAQEE